MSETGVAADPDGTAPLPPSEPQPTAGAHPAPDTLTATATLTSADTLNEGQYIWPHLIGSQRFMTWMLFGCILAAVALVGMVMPSLRMMMFLWNPGLAMLFQGLEGIVYALAAVFGYGFGTLWAWREHRRRFLAALHERGMPGRVEASFTIAEDAFIVDNGRTRYQIDWQAIAMVAPSDKSWLVQSDLQTFNIPKRAFADKVQERAFVAALLNHLQDFVRDGSEAAKAFVAEQDQ